ncbi:MAG: hypothetical protein HYR60_28525 [Acidobacteria bacterium]|nr:hypothetical protein [Acidobacteriota bacterium]MBI3472514.1 hypothetical protein [Candidatus Solibacter usitatus]
MIDKIAPLNVAQESSAPQSKKFVQATEQFEALLLGQIFKSMREEDGQDQSSGAVMELAHEQFAQALASRGGIGLARSLAGLDPGRSPTDSSS